MRFWREIEGFFRIYFSTGWEGESFAIDTVLSTA